MDVEASSIVRQIEGIDSLRDQLGNLADRISKLEADIESRRREIDTLGVQVSEGQKEIQRLQKVRGSEQTLLKNPKGAAGGEES